MTFGQPLFLLGLIAIPLLGWLLWVWQKQRREALVGLGQADLIARLTSKVNWRGRRWRNRMWLAGLALLIFALARPQWGTSAQVVRQEGIQVMVALDISNSMLAQDIRPNRLTRAKQEIIELMQRLNGDEVGLVLFSGASFIQFPLTSDYNTARSFLDTANPGVISRPGTAIGDAINTAMRGFDDNATSQKVIIIMTDGESHEGDPLAAARDAADEDVIIYTIGFGSPDGEPIPVVDASGQPAGFLRDDSGEVIQSRLDELTLQSISDTANGSYFRASASGNEIDLLIEALELLEAGQLESRFEVQAIERFQIFLALAVVLFISAEFIPEQLKK